MTSVWNIQPMLYNGDSNPQHLNFFSSRFSSTDSQFSSRDSQIFPDQGHDLINSINSRDEDDQDQDEEIIDHERRALRYKESENVITASIQFNLFMLASYLLCLGMLSRTISYVWAFGFLGSTSVYLGCKQLLTRVDPNASALQRRAHYFFILNWLLITIFLLFACLRVNIINVPLSPFLILGFVNTLLINKYSEGYSSIMKDQTMNFIRAIFWIQLVLIGLKVDGIVTSWGFTFLAFFYVLVFFMSLSLGFLIIFISLICQALTRGRLDFPVYGGIWDLLNSFYSWVWGFGLIGAISYLSGRGDPSLLILCLKIGIWHGLILSIYTLCSRKRLIEYLSSNVRLITELHQTLSNEDQFKNFRKKIPYLLRISPTYYIVTSGAFQISDRKIARELKHKVHEHKISLHKKHSHLHEGLEAADNGLNSIKLLKRSTSLGVKEVPLSPTEIPLKEDIKYSFDDMVADEFTKSMDLSTNDKKDEKTCYVCCHNEPTAVFLPCGHGGICYDCAMRYWTNGDKCSMCRNAIDEVLKVTLVDRVDVAKVILGTKKIEIPDDRKFS